MIEFSAAREEDLRNRAKPGFENALRGLLATEGREERLSEITSLLAGELAQLPVGEGDAAWMIQYGRLLHSGAFRVLNSNPEETALATFGKTMIDLGKNEASREAFLAALEEFRQKHVVGTEESILRMIIGIAGTLASGKGTVVDYLKSKGFGHYSSSGILKEILVERGQPLTRPYMSALADELMKKYPGGILSLSHERAQSDSRKDYVLEAIHRESEAAYVRSLGGVILGVDADLPFRYERTLRRQEGDKDKVTFEEFVEHSKREDEGATGSGPNIRAVLRSADAVVMNNGSLEELHAQIDAALVTLRT